MHLDIDLYGRLRELAGARTVRITFDAKPADVDALKRIVAAQHPALAPFLAPVAVAVGDDVIAPGAPLPALDEVALLPPVSGG
jgi:molybdopterin converting factor small subunit